MARGKKEKQRDIPLPRQRASALLLLETSVQNCLYSVCIRLRGFLVMAKVNGYIGKQIGNYRVTAKIASGSYGTVYRAQHTILTRTVAIKMMHVTHLNSQKERDGFLKEAKLLEKLKHPHILPIYDVGIEEDSPYMVAEYAAKGSLRSLIKRHAHKPLGLDEGILILAQIGE